MRLCSFGSATYSLFRLCRGYLGSPANNADSILHVWKVASKCIGQAYAEELGEKAGKHDGPARVARAGPS